MDVDGQWRRAMLTLAWSPRDAVLRLICSFDMDPPADRMPAIYQTINQLMTGWDGAFTLCAPQRRWSGGTGLECWRGTRSARLNRWTGQIRQHRTRPRASGSILRSSWPDGAAPRPPRRWRLPWAKPTDGPDMNDFDDINARGLVLVGCGRMGGAMLQGWMARGLDAGAVNGVITTRARPAPERQDRAAARECGPAV